MIEEVLAERGARYGKFANHAAICQRLQEVFHTMPSWKSMDYDMKQALTVIADKIARMGNGDPFYEDNWVDIIGYSTLVLDRIRMIPTKDDTLYPAVPTEDQIKETSAAMRCWMDSERSLNTSPRYLTVKPTCIGPDVVYSRAGL